MPQTLASHGYLRYLPAFRSSNRVCQQSIQILGQIWIQFNNHTNHLSPCARFDHASNKCLQHMPRPVLQACIQELLTMGLIAPSVNGGFEFRDLATVSAIRSVSVDLAECE